MKGVRYVSFQTDNFGEALRVARAKKHITQLEIADKGGFNNRQISLWESGAVVPRADNIYRLCETLNISPNDLFGWVD